MSFTFTSGLFERKLMRVNSGSISSKTQAMITGAMAREVLDVQHYPDLRQYPGGPPQRPHDLVVGLREERRAGSGRVLQRSLW